MLLSRKLRKQEQIRIMASRGKTVLAAAFCVAVLTLAWSTGDIRLFTILAVIFFFGGLLGNPNGIRNHLPGLGSTRLPVRILASLLYVVVVLIIIGITGK